MINSIKCHDSIEVIGIYSDNNAILQWYAADVNETVKIYKVHSSNWWFLTIFYVTLAFYLNNILSVCI